MFDDAAWWIFFAIYAFALLAASITLIGFGVPPVICLILFVFAVCIAAYVTRKK